jgi:hypothetical protein
MIPKRRTIVAVILFILTVCSAVGVGWQITYQRDKARHTTPSSTFNNGSGARYVLEHDDGSEQP